MKKTLYILLLFPVLCFGQARLVINGATPVTIVENGGTAAKPIYIEVNNPAPNAITTIGGNKGWIVSEDEFNMVKWDIGAAAPAIYTLPFGYSTTNYLPLTFNILASGVGAGSVLFSTYHTVPDNWTGVVSVSGPPSDVTQMDPSIVALSLPTATDDSYWVVDRFWIMDATKFGGYTTLPSPNITFSYIDGGGGPSEVAAPNQVLEPNLIAQRFNSTLSKWGDYFGTVGTNVAGPPVGTCKNDPALAVAPANFFRSWTLSSSVDPLPIQLESFNVECTNNVALISWTTATETDNDHFTVERSPDGITFETVATVKGAGNSSTANNYSVTDNAPLAGTSYYRLSQTDFDGKTTSFNPITFNGCKIDGTTISAFNSNGNIIVRINSPYADNYNVMLVNTLGQVLLSQPKSLSAGYNEFILTPSNLTAGIYLLNVRSDKSNYSRKLILGAL